jgi:hypothetical protein
LQGITHIRAPSENLRQPKNRNKEYDCVIIVKKKGGLREKILNVFGELVRNKDET